MSVIRVSNTTVTGKSGYIFTETAPRKNLVRQSIDRVFPRLNLRAVAMQPLKLRTIRNLCPNLSLFVYIPFLNYFTLQFNKLTSVFHTSFLLLIMDFVITL